MAARTQVQLRPWSLRQQHPQHVMYPQVAVIMGSQGYTRHFHQCRARGPPSLCQGTHGGITVEDRILMYQVINHFLSPNAMCPQHGWDGACILQGVWVEHCTLHSAQLLLQQPLQDGPQRQTGVWKPCSGGPTSSLTYSFHQNGWRPLAQLCQALRGYTAPQ